MYINTIYLEVSQNPQYHDIHFPSALKKHRCRMRASAIPLKSVLGPRKKCFVPEGALICVGFGRFEGEKP